MAGSASSTPGPVLIIDDDGEACAIFERILRDNGFEVCTAATAEDALFQLKATRPAAIVLDLRLPTLDGLECLRRFRAMPQLARTPVTVITADYFVDDSVVSQIDALGARLCFKPLWEEDLLRIARESAAR
jgi:DNA-binding response OmpR family regulator